MKGFALPYLQCYSLRFNSDVIYMFFNDKMGKGSNVNKKRAAQAKHAAKAKEEKKGGGGKDGIAERSGAGDHNVTCALCKTKFPTWKAKGQIKGHYESKHSKSTLEETFPGISEAWNL
mmetsp:Transcript_23148/g.28451  ORF Transcript_23148/g.28451 Transcript_23148/m.28451 type:complete len:118 (+) Transcript_23148:241-594(+)